MKCEHLVVDTAAFVKNVSLWEYGGELYTLPEVIEEIRDKLTKQRLEAMPVPLIMRQPQPHSVKFVNEFSKKTGDYASLSLADIKVLALTYELEVEMQGGSEHLRLEPKKIITEGASKKGTNTNPPSIEGFYIPQEKHEEYVAASFGSSPTEQSRSGDMDFENGPSELLPPNLVLLNSNVYPPKVPDISWQHLVVIDNFLEEHSYINGHVPSGKDFIFYDALTMEYPQFCLNEALSSSKCSEDIEILHENEVCTLPSTFPCIRRWALHVSSFTEDEQVLLPSCNQSLDELLHDFEERGHHTEEEKSPQSPQLDDPVTPAPVDISSLSLSEQSKTAKHDEEDENNKEKMISIHLAEDGNDDEEESDADDGSMSEDGGDADGGNMSEDGGDADDGNMSEDRSDDDDGWITPSNLKRHKLKNSAFLSACEEESQEDVKVACMTADFAIQNVLKHIGLSVMGVDGKLIRNLRTFILRCHACFKTTSVMSKIFCPHCGNKTLKKVSVTLNSDGSQKIWINTKKPINKKGMKYSLPTPKGGKHGRNPILVEDQVEAKRFSSKMSRKKVNPLHEDYNPDQSPFAVRDVYSRAAQLGYIGGKNHYHYYWEQRNPNEAKRGTGKKKKKN